MRGPGREIETCPCTEETSKAGCKKCQPVTWQRWDQPTSLQKQELSLFSSRWQIIRLGRVFYLSLKAPVTDEFPRRHVKNLFPHGRPCFNLIKVVTSEEQFRAKEENISANRAEPDIEVNAILQIGRVCKVDRSSKNEVSDTNGILLSCKFKQLQSSHTWNKLFHLPIPQMDTHQWMEVANMCDSW